MLLTSLFSTSRERLEPEVTGSACLVSNVAEPIGGGIVVEAGSVDLTAAARASCCRSTRTTVRHRVDVAIRVRVELYDLTMTERAKVDYPLDPRQHDVGVIVEAILAGLAEVLARSGVSPSAVLGVGIGVPGIVENGPDALVHAQSYGWEAVPLERLLVLSAPSRRCTSTTAPRRWARRSCGSARGGGRSTRSSA